MLVKYYDIDRKIRGAFKYSDKVDMLIHIGYSKKLTLHSMRKLYRKHVGIRIVRKPRYRQNLKFALNALKHPYIRHRDRNRIKKKRIKRC